MNYESNTITAYVSPERYEDYHREYIEIPIPAPISLMPMREGGPYSSEQVAVNRIRLQRYRSSFHVAYGTLRELAPSHIADNFNTIVNKKVAIITIFRAVAQATDRMLREDAGRGNSIHTVIIDKVDVVIQEHTDRLLVEVIFYACRHQDTEHAKRYFQDNFFRLMANSREIQQQLSNVSNVDTPTRQRIIDGLSAMNLSYLERERQRFGAPVGPVGPKYNKKAESRALKLLKSILKPHEFKIYKNDGYVMIQGKSKKMYKVKKGGMIEVSEKTKTKWYNTYRLCIEPKHYGTICPTDEVIAKIKLIQADETKLHKIAKKFKDNITYGAVSWEAVR